MVKDLLYNIYSYHTKLFRPPVVLNYGYEKSEEEVAAGIKI